MHFTWSMSHFFLSRPLESLYLDFSPSLAPKDWHNRSKARVLASLTAFLASFLAILYLSHVFYT